MSRSRKKSHYHGMTTADSEAWNKAQANRRLRRAVRLALVADGEPDVLPELEEVSDRWTFAKDGAVRFDPAEYPEMLRK